MSNFVFTGTIALLTIQCFSGAAEITQLRTRELLAGRNADPWERMKHASVLAWNGRSVVDAIVRSH